MWFTGVPQNVAHQHHPSIGGSATVSQQFQGIIVRGSSSGSAIAGASGFRAGAGGGSAGATIHVNSDCQQATSAESGKPGLLRWSFLLKTFRGGADEFQVSLAENLIFRRVWRAHNSKVVSVKPNGSLRATASSLHSVLHDPVNV